MQNMAIFLHLWKVLKIGFLLKIMILGTNVGLSGLEKYEINLWTKRSHSGPVCVGQFLRDGGLLKKSGYFRVLK